MKDIKQMSNEELLKETKKIYDDYQRAENDLDDDLEAAYRRMLEPYEREVTARRLMYELRKMCGVTVGEEME
mgnify:CR=1 FL=1